MYLRRTVHIVIYKSYELCHHIVISTTSNDVLWLIPFYDGNEGGGNHIFNINGNKMGSFVLPSTNFIASIVCIINRHLFIQMLK